MAKAEYLVCIKDEHEPYFRAAYASTKAKAKKLAKWFLESEPEPWDIKIDKVLIVKVTGRSFRAFQRGDL